jgi:ribosomal-protein-serine acetyltransferase
MKQLSISSRMQLRLLERRDTFELFTLLQENREHLCKWFNWVEDLDTRLKVFYYLHGVKFLERGMEGLQYGILYNNKLIGVVAYNHLERFSNKAQLGYWIANSYEGQGIAREACEKLIDFGFKEMGLNRIEIQCSIDNKRSAKLAERLGFTKEAVLKESEFINRVYVDMVLYRLTHGEWRRSKKETMDNYSIKN